MLIASASTIITVESTTYNFDLDYDGYYYVIESLSEGEKVEVRVERTSTAGTFTFFITSKFQFESNWIYDNPVSEYFLYVTDYFIYTTTFTAPTSDQYVFVVWNEGLTRITGWIRIEEAISEGGAADSTTQLFIVSVAIACLGVGIGAGFVIARRKATEAKEPY